MKNICIMVPAYNEEEVIEIFYQRVNKILSSIKEYDFEILFINDGSKDNTLKIIRKLAEEDRRIKYLSFSRNFGKELAMIAGFDNINADAVIIMDADLQDPPELIPTLIKHWEEGYLDVYAKRRTREGESFLKKVTSFAYYRILEFLSDIPIQKDTGDFRLLDKKAINALKSLRENQRYTKGMFSWIGFEKKEVLFDRDARVAGETKWNYFKLIELAIEGITSFTIKPLRVASFFGIFFSFVSFVFILIIVFKTLAFGDDAQGYPSLMSVILFLGGIQLISLGIIGEYLGRIFKEVKDRPLYLISESNMDHYE